MTRETKVGIVVSCSFLGLLGVVVTSKLRGELPGDTGETPPKATATTEKPTIAPKSTPIRLPPSRGRTDELLAKAQKKNQSGALTDKDKVSPPPAPEAGNTPEVIPAPGGGDPLSENPPVASVDELGPPLGLASALGAFEKKLSIAAPGPVEGELTPGNPPEVVPPPGGGDPLPDNPPVASVADLGPLGIFFPDAPRGEAQPNRTEVKEELTKQKEAAAGQDPAPPPASPDPPAEKVEETTKVNTPVVPVPSAPADSVPTPPPAPGTEPSAALPVVEAQPAGALEEKDKNKLQTAGIEKPALRPIKVPTGGGAELEEPSATVPEKRPAAPAVLTPAVARTTAATKPKVEVFSVEEYAVQPGDTFATISKAKYRTDKYAEALRLFNANDALLSDAGRDAAVNLQPGQSITIPDLTILEKRYSHVIQGLPAGGALVPAKGTSRKTEFDVRPVVDVRLAPGAAPTYEVLEKGVTIREVAAKTLGNGDRWNEVYNLNKEYNPERALPVGSVLKLPADARVPTPAPVPAVP